MNRLRSRVGVGFALVGSILLGLWIAGQPQLDGSCDEQADLDFVGGQETFIMKRDQAIEFGLDQINSAIKYMFVAAAALLAIVVKLLIDPLTSKRGRTLPQETVDWLGCGAIGLLFSLIWGIAAHLYLVNLSTASEFSIYREPAIACCGQLIFVLVAGITIIRTLFSVAMHRR